MPWGGAPSTSAADAVRLLVGDTDADSPLLTDDSYAFFIAQEPNVYARAALAAEALAGKYAPQMDKRIGDLWRSAKVLFIHYSDLAARYRLEAMRRGKPVPYAGGISVIASDAIESDSDRVVPAFAVGMMDAIGVEAMLGSEDD